MARNNNNNYYIIGLSACAAVQLSRSDVGLISHGGGFKALINSKIIYYMYY